MTVWVLDIDDTVYLERDYVRSGFEAVGRAAVNAWGIEGLGDVLWHGFLEGVRGRSFDRALESVGRPVSPVDVAFLVHVYRTHVPHIQQAPDAARFLARADVRGVVTDGPLDSQLRKVRALGLDGLQAVVCTAALGAGAGKPSPAGFRAVERITGVTGPRLGYIADNPAKDFAAPRSLGWRTVRIRRALGLHRDEPSGDDVDMEVETLDDLRG